MECPQSSHLASPEALPSANNVLLNSYSQSLCQPDKILSTILYLDVYVLAFKNFSLFITGKLIETSACTEIIATYIQVNMNQNRSLSPRAMWHSIPADYFQLFSAFFCEIICLFYWEMLTSHCKVIIFCHFTFYTTQSVIQLHFTQHSSKTYKNMSFSNWMVKIWLQHISSPWN